MSVENENKSNDPGMIESVTFSSNIADCDPLVNKSMKSILNLLQTSSGRSEAIESMLKIYNHLDGVTFIKVCPNFVNSCISLLETTNTQKISSKERENAYRLLIELIVHIYSLKSQVLTRDLSKPISKFVQHYTQIVPYDEMLIYSRLLEAFSHVFSSSISGKKQLLREKYFETVFHFSNYDFSTFKKHYEILSSGYVKVMLTGNFRNETRFVDLFSEMMSFYEEYLMIFNVFKMPQPVLNFHFASDYKPENFFMPQKDVINDTFTNLKRLYFVTCCLKNIMKESLSIVMPIPVSAVLVTFQAFTNLYKFKPQDNDSSLNFIIPNLFVNIFDICKTLMDVGRGYMTVFSRDLNIIIRLTLDYLKKTPTRAYLRFKIAFFEFLYSYFFYLNFSHNLQNEDLQSLIQYLLKFINIFEDKEFTLNLQSIKKNIQTSTKEVKVVDSGKIFNVDSSEHKNALLCCTKAALKTLKIVLSQKILLVNEKKNRDVFKEIIRIVICTLFEVYKNWITLPLPYQCLNCRTLMFESFLYILTNCPSNLSPPLETVVAVVEYASKLEREPRILNVLKDIQNSVNIIMNSKVYQTGVYSEFASGSPEFFSFLNETHHSVKEHEVQNPEIHNTEFEKLEVRKPEVKRPEIKKPEVKKFGVKRPEVEKSEDEKPENSEVMEVSLDNDDHHNSVKLERRRTYKRSYSNRTIIEQIIEDEDDMPDFSEGWETRAGMP